MATTSLRLFFVCLSSSHTQLFLSLPLNPNPCVSYEKKKISASPTQEDHFAPEIEHAILGMQPRHLKNSAARSSWCHVRLCQLPGQTERVPVGRPSPHKAINDHGALQQTNWCLAGRAGWAASRYAPTQHCLPPLCPPQAPSPLAALAARLAVHIPPARGSH